MSYTKIIIALVAVLVGWKFYKARKMTYAGYVSTGWAGANSAGNLPAIVNQAAIVGTLSNGAAITGPASTGAMPFVEQGAGGWSGPLNMQSSGRVIN